MTTVDGDCRKAVEEALDAEYAGVGWWGSLYRAPRRRRWYRLVPVEEISGQQRSELAAWQARPRRPDLAPVVPGERGDQRQFAGRWFQIVCYETDARRSLADAIAEDEPADRVASVADVLRALPGWRDAVGPGVVALPADVVLAGHRPLLLPLPGWGPPSLRQVFADPERLAHLTPEAVRGLPIGDRTPGLYALGVAARHCFEALPDDDTGRLLQRIACGTVFTDQPRDGRLPSWMRKVEPVRAVREQLRDLTGRQVAGDHADDPSRLANALDEARRAMDPLAAVRSLRAGGEPRAAVGLAHAALVDRPRYDLLLLAAEIARDDLREPLEALSLLERAVQADPGRSEAYAEQLSIIGGLWSVLQGRLARATDNSFTQRLDATARTAFDRLPPDRRVDQAHDMARCLIGQGRLDEANTFVHRWLHDGKTLMWWRFDLMLDYAETFLLLGHDDAAAQVAGEVRKGLRRVRENGEMNPAEIHAHGMRLADLDQRLLQKRNRETSA
ncbi:hypothetical protein GCM10010451_05140 [Streptomyces virens]|uniref:Tetratricopeptide repeat protein n=1 Tax=Streptomyces virens TaxID=285572 RepID=A0ABP6NWU0_9ACTN|nr:MULTISPECIES: hypothetical protein [Streptomyces]MBA8975569.1 tetratricopeptide (TPR) repeat protein [Streptomyces calvus]MYS27754.1 hypothetical protein [Streptomyces sp. SID7804]